MASNQSVQVTLGFQADTSNARKAIQDLNAQLNKLQSFSMDNLHVSNDIEAAAEAAKVLQQNLQGAMNFNTGQLNITQFAQNLKNAGTSVTELSQKLINAGTSGTQTFTALGRAIASMDVPLKQTNTLINNMMTTLKNTAKWELSSNLVHGLESAFSNAISYAKNLNSALNDIRIVSGASVEQMAKFAVEANAAAKSLGTTTRAYADAALIYYQQGDSAEMAAKKAEITLKATNAAFSANAQQMSEMLTATWNSYQAGADELEHMVDVMANLGAHTATSMEEIATSLQKVAATANTVGVSMEQMSAMISTVSSVTRQSAQTIGTSMNTILSRIGGLKLGQTLEDGVDLNKYSKALASVGVQVLDAQGQLRNMGAVIDELGEKWNQLSTAQQSALAQTVGGTRQYTSLMALFSNWDKYKENFDLTQNSDGALQKMQDTYLESWEGASQQLKASLESVYQTLIDDEGMIKFTKSITAAVEQVQNLIQSFGGLPGILTQIGTIALQVFSKNIGQGIASSIASIKTFANSFKDLKLIGETIGTNGLNKKEKMQYYQKAMGLTTSERVSNQFMTKMWEEMGTAKSANEGNAGMQAQIDASQILIDKKLELQQVESSLSATEKANAQAQIAALNAQANQIETLSAAYAEETHEVERIKDAMTSITQLSKAAHEKGITTSNNPAIIRKKMSKKAIDGMYHEKSTLTGEGLFNLDPKKFKESQTGVQGLINHFERLNRIITQAETASAKMSNALTSSVQDPAKYAPDLLKHLEMTQARLKELGTDTTELETIIKELKTAIAQGNKDQITDTIEKARTHLDKLSMSSDTASSAARTLLVQLGVESQQLDNLAQKSSGAEEATIRLSQGMRTFLETANKTIAGTKNIGKNVSQLISALAALGQTASSTYNLMANWDSSSTVAKFSQITMAAMSAMNSMKQMITTGASIGAAVSGGNPIGALIGGGVGLLASIGTTIASGISGAQEAKKKSAEEALANRVKASQTRADDSTAEVDNLKELISTYNELYTKYEENNEITEELTSAAQALAEAYGITGSAVSIITGNFDEFNRSIRESLNLEKEISKTKVDYKLASQNMLMAAESAPKPTKINSNVQQRFERDLPKSVRSILSSTSLIDDSEAVSLMTNAMKGDSDSQQKFLSYIMDTLWHNGLNTRESEGYGLIGQKLINLNQGYSSDQYWDTQFDASKRINDLLNAFNGNFIDTINFLLNQVVDGIGKDLNPNIYKELSLNTVFEKFLGTNLSGINTVDGIFDAIQTAGFDDERIKSLQDKYGDLTEGKYGSLWNKNKSQLQFNARNEDELLQTYDLAVDYYEYLNGLIVNLPEDDSNRELLSNIRKQVEAYINDEKLKQSVEQVKTLKHNLAEKVLAQEAVRGTIGLNSENSSLENFYDIQADLMETIENNASLFEELNEFGTQTEKQIRESGDPELADKYKEAKKKIANRLLRDYSDLDNFIAMSEAIEQNYSGEQQDAIKGFIKDKNIKSINNAFLTYTKTLFNGSNEEDLSSILTDNETNIMTLLQDSTTDINEIISKYESLTKASSLLKSNMSLQDASELYTLFQDNMEQWSQFVAAKDMDTRTEILNNIIETNKNTAKAEIEKAYTDTKNQYDIQSNAFFQAYGKTAGIDQSYDAAAEKNKQYSAALNSYYDYRDANFTKTDNGYVNKDGEKFTEDQILEQFYKTSSSSGLKEQLGAMASLENLQGYVSGFEAITIAKQNMDKAFSDYNVYQLFTSSMDESTQAVGKLVSAFNSFPKTTAEAKEIAELLGGTVWDYDPNIDEHSQIREGKSILRQFTPEELMGLSKEEYNDRVIAATKREIENIQDPVEKYNAQDQLYEMEKQQRDLKTTNEKQILSELQAEYQKLSSIDITKMPKAGTSAYQALAKALKAVNIQMRDFNKMSDVDKVGALYKARQASLEQQRETALQIANAYNPKNEFSEGMDLSNKDADFIKRYQEWWNLYKEVINLDDQIKDSSTDEAAAKMAVLTKEAEAIDKRMKDAQTEASKLQTEAQTFTNAIQTGELSASQRVGLSDKDIAKWDSLTSAEQRAAFAATKWSEAVIAGQQAFEKSQTLINNGIEQLNLYNERTDWKILASRSLMSKDFINKYQDNPMIAQAYNQAINKGTIVEGTTTIKDGITALKAELESMGEDGKAAWEKIEAAGIDAMNNVYKTAVQNEQTAAQEAVKAWQNAYNTIAEIRKSLFNKEDIGSVFLDPEKARALAKSLGVTVKEAYQMYLDGTIDPKKMKQVPFDEIAAAKSSSFDVFGVSSVGGKNFKNFRQNYYRDNRKQGETIADFYANRRESLMTAGQNFFDGFDEHFGFEDGTWKKYLDSIINGTVTDEQNTILQEWTKNMVEDINVVKEHAQLQDSIMAKEQERDALIAKQNEIQKEAETQSTEYSNLASLASSIFGGKGENLAASYLKDGQDANKVLSELNEVLGTQYKDIEDVSLQDWGEAADEWRSLSATETQKAADASTAIVGFWDQFIADLISLKAPAGEIEKAREARDAADKTATSMQEKANAATQSLDYNSIKQWSDYAGVDEKEFVKLAKAFEDLDQSTDILKEKTDEYRKVLYEATAIAERMRQGAVAIGKHYKDNKKDIEDLTKATDELTESQKATVEKMKDNLSKAFNVEKKYLSDKFIKDHVKDYEELAQGSEKAAKRIQKALTDEIGKNFKKESFSVPLDIDIDGVKDGITNVQSTIDAFLNQYENAPIGINIDSGPALNALNNLLLSGAATANDLQAYFDAVGYHPDVQLKFFDLKSTHETNGKIMYDIVDPASGKTHTVPANIAGAIYADNGIWLPQIGGISKVGTAKQTANAAGGGSKGGGGGGGGGGSKPKHKEYKGDEEIERYHQINRQIEYQERLLKRVNLLKQQRYGLGYLRALEQENAELMKHIELVQRRAGPTQAGYWLENAKQIMAQFGVTYDSTGQINYRPYMFNLLDFYNQGVDQYNAMVDSGVSEEEAQEWFDKNIQKVYDRAKEAIAKYEEAMDYQLDAIEMTMEDLNKISANLKEMAVYKMQFKIELDEHDIKRLDFIIKRYDDYLDKQDESADLLMKNMDLVMKDLDYTGEAFDDLFNWYHIKVKVFDENAKWFQSMTSMEEDLKKQTQSFLNDADYVGGLQEVADKIMENLEKLEEYRKQMLEVYGHTIELAADKLENFTNTLEHHIAMYDGYLEVLELISDGNNHYLEDIQLLEGAYNSSLTEIAVIREHLNVLLDQRQKLLTQMENPIYASNEKIQKDFEALEERIEELEEQLLDATKTTLDKAKAMFDKALEYAIDKMSRLGDVSGTNIDWLTTQYDFWQKEQDQYVDRITQVYEVDKLVRDIEKSIADTRNKNNQAQLKALEDEIQLRSKNNALNEYSIEMMRLSYELLLAQQNLENANESKDTVRLTRDDNGNYIYQYTADEDKIAEAQQKYNDVLYEMNQTTKERYRELVQSGLDYQKEFIDKYREIMEDMTLSDEEKTKRVEELYEHYANLLEGIDIFMDEVLQNMGENQYAWTQNMNQNLMDTAGTAKDQLSNIAGATREQLWQMYDNSRQDADTWKKGTMESINLVDKAWTNYRDRMLEVQKTSDITLQTMIKQITEYGKQAATVNDQASALAKTMQDVLDKLVKMNEQWISMDQKLQKVIDQYLELHKIIGEEEKKVAGKDYEVEVEEVPLTPAEQEYFYQSKGSIPGKTVGTNAQGQLVEKRYRVLDPVTKQVIARFKTKEEADEWVNARRSGALSNGNGGIIETDPDDGTYTYDKCNGGCTRDCTDDCTNGCKEKCSNWCGQHCASGCNDGCGSSCTTGCKGGCKNECSDGCAVGCKTFCTGSNYPQDPSKGSNGPATGISTGKKIKAATGGLNTYTGIAWLDGTFQKPEYVLNAEQTHEMFSILNDHTIYRLIDTMTAATQAMLSSMGLHAGSISTQSLVNSTNAPMTTYITAEFPNATDHNEIELALQNLVNNTAQSINRFMN